MQIIFNTSAVRTTLQLFEKFPNVSKVASLMETTLTPGKYRVGWLHLQIKRTTEDKAIQDYSQTTQESPTLFQMYLTRDFRERQ